MSGRPERSSWHSEKRDDFRRERGATRVRLTTIRPGDIVRGDVGGRLFLAFVESNESRTLGVAPITPNITYRQLKARQVVAHWRKAKV